LIFLRFEALLSQAEKNQEKSLGPGMVSQAQDVLIVTVSLQQSG